MNVLRAGRRHLLSIEEADDSGAVEREVHLGDLDRGWVLIG
jgi:hypothetical protein